MDLKTIKKHWFWPIIALYIALGICLLYIDYVTPYLGIELEKVSGQWRISELNHNARTYENPPKFQDISVGDIVISIDNISPQNISRIQYDPLIRDASKIVIEKSDERILHVNFKQTDILKNFYTLFIFPLIYFLLTLVIMIYLNYRERNIQQVKLLIIFIFSVSLAYTSLGASGKINLIGLMVNSSCMILSLVILLSFLKSYFAFLNIKWIFTKYVRYIYVLPICAAILD